MIDSASSTELGEPMVAQPLFAPSGPARRPPLVRGSENIGPGGRRVELLLRMRPCRRDRRGTRWQADPLKHMKVEPLLVGLEHLRSVKWACWSEKLQQARTEHE